MVSRIAAGMVLLALAGCGSKDAPGTGEGTVTGARDPMAQARAVAVARGLPEPALEVARARGAALAASGDSPERKALTSACSALRGAASMPGGLDGLDARGAETLAACAGFAAGVSPR